MHANTLKHYHRRGIPWLIKKATTVCNKYIRTRDEGKPCVSCGRYTVLQAGHFYSAGHHACVRFYEFNIWGQCERCNFFLHGNLIAYRVNILERISPEELKKIDTAVSYYKKKGWKWDRIGLIDVIEEYKEKIKLL